MSLLMRGDRRTDSLSGGSALVPILFLRPPPHHLISSLFWRGDGPTAVTHVECICHRTKKAICPAIRPNMEAFLRLLVTGAKRVVIREAVAHLRMHDITNTILHSLFFPGFYATLSFFFFLSRVVKRKWEQRRWS